MRPGPVRLALLLAALPLAVSFDPTAIRADDVARKTPASGGGPRAPAERVSSELVLIETTVRDARGRPISGLAVDDFVLLVDGRKRPIASIEYREFSPTETGAPQPGGPPGGAAGSAVPKRAPHDTRRFVLFFEDATSAPVGLEAARRAADRFLATALDPSDEVALAAFDTSLRMLHDFTTDRADLRATIAASLHDVRRVSNFAATRASHEEEILRLLTEADQGTAASSQGRMKQGGESNMGRAMDEVQKRLDEATRLASAYAAEEAPRLADLLKALGILIDALAPWPGFKAIVFMGDGVPENPALPYLEPILAKRPPEVEHFSMQQRMPRFPDIASLIDRYSLATDIKDLAETASASGVTLYTVQTEGLVAGTATELRAAHRRSNTLETIALNTGGVASSSNDILAALRNAEATSEAYYVLGYAPEGPPDGRYHTLQVRLAHGKATVRCRRGFTRFAPSEAHTRTLRAALLLPELYPDLAFDLSAVAGPGSRSDRVEDLVLHVPGEKILFLSEAGRSVAHLEVGIIATDGSGRETFRTSRKVRIALGEDLAGAAKLGIDLFCRATLPAGDQSVTAIISDLADGVVGSARLPLVADVANGSGLLGLSIYSLAEKSVWVELPAARQSGEEELAAGTTLGPALKKSFAPREPLACGFKVAGGVQLDTGVVRLLVRGGQGAVIRTETVELQSAAKGAVTIRLPFDDLPSGDFTLDLEVKDSSGKVLGTGSLPFRIGPPGGTNEGA